MITEDWKSKSWKIRDHLEKAIKCEATWLNQSEQQLSDAVLAEKAATWLYCSNYLWDWYCVPVDSKTQNKAYEVLERYGSMATHLNQLALMLPTPLGFAKSLADGTWNDEGGYFELSAAI